MERQPRGAPGQALRGRSLAVFALLLACTVLSSAGTPLPGAGRLTVARENAACQRARFTSSRVIPADAEIFSIAIADFTGDGRPDLAVGSVDYQGVTVYVNDGPAGFHRAPTALSGKRVRSLVAADFDGDGKMDIVASTDSNGLVLLLGNGTGGLSEVSPLISQLTPTRLVAADFNRDGKNDFVALFPSGDAIQIALGDGAGHFTLVASGAASVRSPRDLLVGDFNKDGRPDVAVTSDLRQPFPVVQGVTVFLGDGAGGFSSSVEVQVAGSASVASGDFNGDGLPDLAITSGTGDLSILLGSGTGTFSLGTPIPVGPQSLLVVNDWNRDLREDIAVIRQGDVQLLEGDGAGHFAPSRDYVIENNPYVGVSADLDGDGKADLVIGHNGAVSILAGDGAGGLDAVRIYPAGATPSPLAVGDFNGDGHADVVTIDATTNEAVLLLGDGSGHYGPPARFPAGLAPQALVSGDFNRDGHLDVAVLNAPDSISILLGDGHGRLGSPRSVAGVSGRVIATADFDGDGKLDLAVSSLGVQILRGDGSGGFAAPQTFPNDYSASGIVTADFNGDGRMDVAISTTGGPAVSVFLGRGDGTLDPPIQAAVEVTGTWGLDVGDFDRDGNLDVVYVNAVNTVSVLLGTGDGHFAPAVRYDIGDYPAGVRVADLNGDGILDFVVVDNVFSYFVAFIGDGHGGFSVGTGFGAGNLPGWVVVSDLDEDGLPDLSIGALGSGGVAVFLNRSFAVFPTSLPPASVGVPYTARVTASGGTSPYAFTSSGSTPPGLVLDPSGSLAGTPNTLGTFAFSATASDASGCAVSRPYTVQVRNPAHLTVTASPTPVVGGQPLTLTIVVTGGAGSAPTGTVTILVDGVAQTPMVLGGGVATLTVTGLATGPHTVEVRYEGDALYSPASLVLAIPAAGASIPTVDAMGFVGMALALAIAGALRLRSAS